MIPLVFQLLLDHRRNIGTPVSCILTNCVAHTQWQWLPDRLNLVDLITALGALGSFIAVIFAAVAIFQSAKARNLATVIELTRQLSSEREKAHQAKIYGMEDHQFHAFQMVHLVEQASMIVNQGWVSGQSKEFLLDWLRLEIPSMADQPAYQENFQAATGQELIEVFKLRDKFAAERARDERNAAAELKEAEHFERVIEDAKARQRRRQI
ncbi:hypothetical protein ACCT03_00155 [Rhizobium johnstonii]|uniref:hypothetical protein n=1 Tax=Rhizobium TaxID=379 RepID=UPI001032607E|nr:hypothetical protein [Rhizobium leguminosarum]NKL64890.1 hypothetical protein [Rhizobium leguminosarum bv. viciae]TBF83175.1 hypothetical protein ELG86_14060 [Rhizobium leguminosarum]TBH02624.1 hypothetical protein ELG70_13820 [Rhizobium leguminosarum]TBH12070.1 hypothetical protein ELG68_13455 [Rhizobium leguminosarum]TBH37119.1 hypothetical protein ELG66_15405 [Rhizobium leguminosarum]